ncbi:DUF5682 family protein [Nocardioides zeae]|uniref:DUF5682 family protein n=1 Tax=Nocardioides imazamoxiresistens TaxID=3231893 RepID=A0ABU3PRY4_9ACTN|nr:DUF5682 family protein [Nocardioides zeae]MDT9591991.1 DUF5682 family protein [Nocardioides zeae]
MAEPAPEDGADAEIDAEVGADGICWVPVRHHSPAATRAVRDLVARLRPVAVLVEGPADYRRVDQLLLPHEPPVALMTWWRRERPDGTQVAYALYPFAVFSPEWHAVRDGAAVGADVRFIDLPWHLQVLVEHGGYADTPAAADGEGVALQRADEVSETFFERLSAHTGRREMSAVWDEVAEIDPGLTTSAYLRRAAVLGAGIRANADARAGRPDDRALDLAREAHMAAEVRRARAEHSDGVLLVVTGAAHTAALRERLGAPPRSDEAQGAPAAPEDLETGHALVRTSYPELDEHRGYLAGQPSPGYYDRVHRAGATGRAEDADGVTDVVLAEAVAALRKAGAPLSAADLVATRATMLGLASLRDHARPWRDDLVDALTSTLVKDTVAADAATSADGGHPLVNRVRELMRGDAVGRLAPGTDLPPLVHEVEDRCARLGMPLGPRATTYTLDLEQADDRERAQLLQRLRVLDVPAARLVRDVRAPGAPGPVDVPDARRPAPGARVTERVDPTQEWTVRGGPAVGARAVLASRFGASIEQAVLAVLVRRAASGEVADLASTLLDAVLCGLPDLTGRMGERVEAVTLGLDRLDELTVPLDVLLRLHRFERWYATAGRADLDALLRLVGLRCVELLERLGPQASGAPSQALARALRRVVDAVVASPALQDLEPRLAAALVAQLERGATRSGHAPEALGALTGARWLLESATPSADGSRTPQGAPDPVGTGEWYAGLLTVAGHLALAAPEIFDPLDAALRQWDDADFRLALPDLRRAAGNLLPRERRALLDHLRPPGGAGPGGASALVVPPAVLADLLVREDALWTLVEQHTGPLRTATRATGAAGSASGSTP